MFVAASCLFAVETEVVAAVAPFLLVAPLAALSLSPRAAAERSNNKP